MSVAALVNQGLSPVITAAEITLTILSNVFLVSLKHEEIAAPEISTNQFTQKVH